MLKSLVLSNFVIIKSLTLNFQQGLSIFTGETGAGKSIILDAILIAAGSKATKDVIREGADKASILAVFNLNNYGQELNTLLQEFEIEAERELIIRRVISNNGTSKAFINDTPVSANLLKQIGSLLLEVHGQFDNQKLLNQSFHIEMLDNFINKELLLAVKNTFNSYKLASNNYNDLKNNLSKLEAEQSYLEFILDELNEADIKPNEEAELFNKRIFLLEHEKINSSLNEANKLLSEDGKVLYNVNKIIIAIEKNKTNFENNSNYNKLIELLNNVYSDLSDCEALIDDSLNKIEEFDLSLDEIEERLMLIRTLAKKHKVNSMELPELTKSLQEKQSNLQGGEYKLNQLLVELERTKQEFIIAANNLSEKRTLAALELDQKINQELIALKLPNAKFITKIVNNLELSNEYNYLGFNKVIFQIKTNLDGEFKDLNKIASGGEMARFMLAIKVVLTEKNPIPTIIFDEIDIGVGGEVAHSVGTRLVLLAKFMQLLVVTHSHQVAALGKTHYKVVKYIKDATTLVDVHNLSLDERVNELARMISADKITDDAKAIALNLLNNN